LRIFEMVFFKGARQCQRDAFRLPALSSLTVQIAPTQRPTVGRGRHCRRERWSWQHRWSFLEGLTPEKVRSFNRNQNLRAKNLAQLEWTTRTTKKCQQSSTNDPVGFSSQQSFQRNLRFGNTWTLQSVCVCAHFQVVSSVSLHKSTCHIGCRNTDRGWQRYTMLNGGFLKWRYPQFSSMFFSDFPRNTPSRPAIGGIPHDLGNLQCSDVQCPRIPPRYNPPAPMSVLQRLVLAGEA
jgi:hypothetical protein